MSAEAKQRLSDARRGFKNVTQLAAGSYCENGYRLLTMQQGHPLANRYGRVAEHRKVLYDKIGPGPHPCHWECGKNALVWGGRKGIYADHLDGDSLNNDPDNLVPSCNACNAARKNMGNSPGWISARKKRFDLVERIISLHQDGLTSQEILDAISV